MICVLVLFLAVRWLGQKLQVLRRRSFDRIWSAQRYGHRQVFDPDAWAIAREPHPMAELPQEWRIGDDGFPAPNWVAALHRSRSGH